jgi:serine/threonine-protein kinase
VKVCPVCETEYGEEAAFCSRDRSPLRPADGSASPGLVGQLVAERYQVERALGAGGMGEVYLARHVLMGRPCALKVMSPALSRDPDALSRFNREATNASRVSHPNVCAIYDFGLTGDGLVYLAMEYLEGSSLSDLLERSGPLALPRAIALLGQCAAGLAAAHELGIVHRDLKPDNIMVLAGRAGGTETAKLVDFGIAKAVEGEPGQRVTRTGFVVGTPEYMSPEQLAGDPVDGRTDQYALALVFYRMLTGRLPFEGGSLQETLVKRLTDPPRPLAEVRPELRFPAGLQAVLDRALARWPDQRFPEVGGFIGAVEAAAGAPAEVTRKLPDGAAPGPTRRIPARGRPRAVRAAAGLAGAVLVGAGAWALLGPDPGVADPPSAREAGTAAESPTRATGTLPPGAPPASAPGPLAANPERPAPPPPSPGPAALDTARLDVAALETTRRPAELARARRQLDMLTLPAARRAEAAAFLGLAALDERNRDSARALYRMAYRLDPRTSYRTTLLGLGDTLRP